MFNFQDDTLKNAPSYKAYNDFEKEDDVMKKSYTDAIGNAQSDGNPQKNKGYPCHEFLSFEDSYKEKAYMFCKKIETILNKKIYNMEKGDERKKHCLHYKYWVYGTIMNMHNSQTESKYVSTLVKKLMALRTLIADGYIDYSCQYHFNDNYLNDLKGKIEKKYLHDYFNNYDIIKSTISSCKEEKIEVYQEYLNSIIKLYDIYKEDLCSDYYFFLVNSCDDYFKYDEIYNPKFLLNILQRCKDKNLGTGVEVIPSNEIGEVSLGTKDFRTGNQISNVKLDCVKGYYWHGKQNYYSLICYNEKEGDIENPARRISSFSLYQSIFNGFFASVGIFLIFFLLYKFTPFGSRIQHKIWDKGNNYNLEHQNDEIILDTSTNEDIYSYKNKYNIQYHSA
ncbi:PIR Superfamily Protein [Plasmodium ovale wallikeri]|uniref:PIR Superfamily Protein n=1 Tax=Plasmodium ovale wallikeri TaxID=864142 RepID=A0A1A9AQ80_PLAOA|nr:PIR Superfamily Protein [Plasmodium ovale wallikeri]SBT58846.1 PIR Superfamily Protein [Plasmodium ovale wallikeri]